MWPSCLDVHAAGETDTDSIVTYTFEPGKPFVHDAGGLSQKIVCSSNPVAPNIIRSQVEVAERNWTVESMIMFTPRGMNVTVTNKEGNVSMTAHYSRMADPWTLKRKKLLRVKELM